MTFSKKEMDKIMEMAQKNREFEFYSDTTGYTLRVSEESEDYYRCEIFKPDDIEPLAGCSGCGSVLDTIAELLSMMEEI